MGSRTLFGVSCSLQKTADYCAPVNLYLLTEQQSWALYAFLPYSHHRFRRGRPTGYYLANMYLASSFILPNHTEESRMV